MSNSLCGGASFGGSRSLSKILVRASHRAVVTGEWYIPGHKAMAFLSGAELEPLIRGEASKGVVAMEETTGIVPFTGIVFEVEFKSMGVLGLFQKCDLEKCCLYLWVLGTKLVLWDARK